MPEVFFTDDQDVEDLPRHRLQRLATFVLASQRAPERAEVSLVAVDTDTMAGLNARYRSRRGPTDVLSFPIDDPTSAPPGDPGEPGGPPLLLGDVVICPTVARQNAPLHAGTYEDELDLLVVHGILHLLGHDHDDDTDAERMEALERRLLGAFGQVVTDR